MLPHATLFRIIINIILGYHPKLIMKCPRYVRVKPCAVLEEPMSVIAHYSLDDPIINKICANAFGPPLTYGTTAE